MIKKLSVGCLSIAAVLFFGVAQATASLSYSQWIAQFNVPADQRGFQDDPAGDGVSNAVKFALGLNPEVASRDELPNPQIINHEGQQRLSLTIPKNPDAAGVEFIVEVSGDLINWAATAEIVEETATLLRVVDPVATTAANRRFMRLVIPAPADGQRPDAYLFVVGGRVAGTAENQAPDVDPAIDAVIGNFNENVRSILVADVNLGSATVTNWRRAGMLPLTHPTRTVNGVPAPVQWGYIHDQVHVHNGRIYVSSGTVGTGAGSTTADFVAWADIDMNTGTVGEFTKSPIYPTNPDFQRIGASAMVEVDGITYYYVLGGTSSADRTARTIYAPVDATTGAVGPWSVSSTPMPQVDWFHSAISVHGTILASNGNEHGTNEMRVQWVTPSAGGNITTPWTHRVYSTSDTRRWDHVMLRADVNNSTFVYLVGGVDNSRTLDTVHYSEVVNGVPTSQIWPTTATLPAPRRRLAGASIGNMLVIPGGSPDTGFANSQRTVYIGTADATGALTWTVSEEQMMQARSYHGAVIAPVPQN